MKIIIDTNIINKDYKLHGKYIVTLSGAAAKLGYDVCVPEVVVDEIVSHYKDELLEAHDTYNKGVSKLKKLLPEMPKSIISELTVEDQLQKFREQYESELQAKNIKILPYPNVDHKSIVAKELEKKKPFKDSQKGYRDSLIWETVKSELIPAKDLFDECQILLLTRNIKDFADACRLHKDLKDELLELGYSDNVIELVIDCEKFFKDVIQPEFEELDKIKEAFNAKGSYNRISVQNDIAQIFNMQFVEHMLDSVDDYGLQMYLPYYCESPFVEFVDDPIVETESVIRLADGTVMIGCNVRIGAEISYYIDRSNFGDAYDDIHPHVTNYEHNDHYLEVSNLIELNAVVNIRATKMLSKILTTEVIPRSIDFVPYES